MKLVPGTLRGKLIVVFLLPTLSIVCVFSIITYVASRQGLEEELGKRLMAIAQTVASQMSYGLDAKQLSRVDESKGRVLTRFSERIDAVLRDTRVNRVVIFSPDQNAIVDTGGTAFGERMYALDAHAAEIGKTVATRSPQSSVLYSTANGFEKLGFAPIVDRDELGEESVVAIVAIEGSAGYFSLLNNLATLLLVLAIAGILLVVIVASFFSRGLTRPIADLVTAAQRLGQGEYDRPIATEHVPNDEIGFLTKSFEEMRGDIVRRDEQMQMMLSGIAHEVRNPLGGMALFCGLLEEDLKGNPDALKQVDKIQKELGYLERVVTDFLDFARNIPITAERFAAEPFFEELKTLLDGDAGELACTLRVTVDDGMEISAGREKLRRALINVVRNAFQACGGGGEVVIEATAPSPGTRRIEIRDNGPGIAEEDIERVLAPFFTTREKGSGLGLALTKRIIEEHHGEMSIESRLGGGTKIVFNLPFDETVRKTGSFTAEDIPEGWMG